MQTSKQFANVVRAALAAFALVLLGAVLSDITSPRVSVSAQGAGSVGIAARLTPVFFNQSISAHGSILPDIGQGLNILVYCTTGFTGSIQLEWAPPPNNQTFLPLEVANYPTQPDTGCHALGKGGYYPNLRASVTRLTGSVNAWYTSNAGPVEFLPPAIGTNGATSPVTCDQTVNFQITSTGRAAITPTTGTFIVVCSQVWSFAAATTTGNVTFGFYPDAGCTSGAALLINYTTAATPQTLPISQSFRAPSPSSGGDPCWINTSGANMNVSVSYAYIQSP